MTCSCLCCTTGLQARIARSSLKAGLCRKLDNPPDPSTIDEHDIAAILRLVVGDSIDFSGKIFLR